MHPLTRQRLSRVSTATLTTVLFKKGLNNTFLQNVWPVSAKATSMVGIAYTLRYIPAREDLDSIDAFNDRSHPQRVAVEQCPPGHVLVMDSRGDASAASAGNLLLTRLMRRGVAGVVTDGGFRDSPEIAGMDIPAYHQRPSAPTNLIRHHAVDIGLPIACGGVAIYPGDVIMGDAEGVVCIPRAIADEVAQVAYQQTIYEDWVAVRIDAGDSLLGTYPLTDNDAAAAFELWKAEHQSQYPLAKAQSS
ncbi:ribonuclease activity regulator RraA [Acidovorax sp. LjRoot194]|uniref:ribonuclease activity regulator RraA n=1 Tax=Acidovorax sp. LjRoot194 TaxID=3342280 RepID=UPI003ECD55CC